MWLVLLALVTTTSIAVATFFWIPVMRPGPIHPGKRHYLTVRVALSPPASQHSTAAGIAKLVCNGGDDADRLSVRASGLPRNAACKVWFSQYKTDRRNGSPFETNTDDAGSLHFSVEGLFCDLKHYPALIVVIENKVALVADLLGDSLPPSSSPRPSASARTASPTAQFRTTAPIDVSTGSPQVDPEQGGSGHRFQSRIHR